MRSVQHFPGAKPTLLPRNFLGCAFFYVGQCGIWLALREAAKPRDYLEQLQAAESGEKTVQNHGNNVGRVCRLAKLKMTSWRRTRSSRNWARVQLIMLKMTQWRSGMQWMSGGTESTRMWVNCLPSDCQ